MAYIVSVELRATASKYWAYMEFEDRCGKRHTANVEKEHNGTANGNALQAAIEAVRILKTPCVLDIHTDNEYLAHSITNGWVANWEKNGWKNAKGVTVPHKDQWQELTKLLSAHSRRFTVAKHN